MAIELEPKPALCHCHGITEQIEQREGPAICAFVTWRYSIFGLAEDYKTLPFCYRYSFLISPTAFKRIQSLEFHSAKNALAIESFVGEHRPFSRPLLFYRLPHFFVVLWRPCPSHNDAPGALMRYPPLLAAPPAAAFAATAIAVTISTLCLHALILCCCQMPPLASSFLLRSALPHRPQRSAVSWALGGTSKPKIAVVGGGLAGLSTAFHLLEKTAGECHVTVFDRASVGTAGASSVAGGCVPIIVLCCCCCCCISRLQYYYCCCCSAFALSRIIDIFATPH